MSVVNAPVVELPAMITGASPDGDQAAIATIENLKDAEKRNVLEAIDQDGPEFDATLYLSASIVEQLRQYAEREVRQSRFDHEFLMQMIESFDAGSVPHIDDMLNTLKLQDHADMARTLQDTTKRMKKIGNKVPEIDAEWLEQIEQGKVSFRKVVSRVKHIAGEIQDTLRLWDSFKDEFDRADQSLRNHQEQMRDSRVRNDRIAQAEYTRAMKLIQLCATLAMVREQIGIRLSEIHQELVSDPNNEELTREKRRLENLTPIVVNTMGSLIPLIPTTSNNGIIFTNQRNNHALQEFRLYLFRQFGMSQWKANTVIQLNAANHGAAELVLSLAQETMNEEGQKASEAYLAEMSRVAENLREFMIDMETFRSQVNAVVEGGEILVAGLKEADKKARQVSREINSGQRKVDKAQNEWSRQLRAVAAGEAEPV